MTITNVKSLGFKSSLQSAWTYLSKLTHQMIQAIHKATNLQLSEHFTLYGFINKTTSTGKTCQEPILKCLRR